MNKDKRTEKKLLEWIGWEKTYFANNSLFSKEHNSTCRNQLKEIVAWFFAFEKAKEGFIGQAVNWTKAFEVEKPKE